jgi:ABC-type transporter MlaC component
MYADLKHIIESTPDDYFQKDFQKSLFLLAANTAQRANTLVSVKFDEVYINKDRYNGQITAITVTFNTTKGTKDHAGIRKTIQFNRNDPLMCFIEAFRKYLQRRYNIDLESYNTEREKFKGKKNLEYYSI